MNSKHAIAVLVCLAGCVAASAQQANQLQPKIDSSNRTLTVNAEERVSADADLAILHIGFQTPPSDAKTAYAAGAKISNEVVTALKQAGIPFTVLERGDAVGGVWRSNSYPGAGVDTANEMYS